MCDPAAGDWEAALPGALRRLGGSRFAVRSSAPGEDSAQASFAGQYLTVLDVPGEEAVPAVRQVSVSGPGAGAYAKATGRMYAENIPVLVQPMLAPVAAGVAFTRNPLTGARQTVIEAVRGTGDGLVSGSVNPQRWWTDADGALVADGTPDVLSLAQARAVMDLAHEIETLLGDGQDVEWALDGEGSLWVLQSRPITTGATNPAAPVPAPLHRSRALASGTASSPGTARGRLRILSGLDDFACFKAGEVVVCRATSPAWTPVLARASAVITEVGGILAHAAIVARELGIPAVSDVHGATNLPEGALVVVDGFTGRVTLLEEE
ncbi:UNVERIFIED_ORG: pyruvate,water dikinase [Arthrobacter globiformis]|nr:pyruvate,water dikinase [Arthrobacter globiformis]